MTQSPGFNFKDWYEENGGDLNKRRRGRYDSDPEYRARVLELNRQSREKRRKDRQVEREAEKDAKRLQARLTPWKTVTVEKGKEKKTLHTIGALAKSLGVSVQIVRLWEKQKVLPPAPARNKKGDRLYTSEYCEVARKVLLTQGRLDSERLRRVRETPASRVFLGTVQHKKKQFTLTLFRIGMLARALQRTVVTMEQMEQRGVLPATPFRSALNSPGDGYRLYSREMIEDVRKAMEAQGGSIRGESNWKTFHDAVVSSWTKLGVFDMKLVSITSQQPES